MNAQEKEDFLRSLAADVHTLMRRDAGAMEILKLLEQIIQQQLLHVCEVEGRCLARTADELPERELKWKRTLLAQLQVVRKWHQVVWAEEEKKKNTE